MKRDQSCHRIAGDLMSREQFWFFHPFRVRYSEIDGQGIVFNVHYLTYFDTTITEYFRALGYDPPSRPARISTSSNRSLNTRRRSGSTGNWTSVRAWHGSAAQA